MVFAVTQLLLGDAVLGAERSGKTTVLLVGKQPDHPHGTHMYLHTCEVLRNCLRQTDGVEAIVSDGWPTDPTQLEGLKTIVAYTDPAAELLLDGPHRDEVIKLLNRGVGLVTIHWASTVQRENLERLGPRWMEYLGGTWVSNVGLSTDTSPLKQLLPDHPICRGWDEYELLDEFYLNPSIDQGRPLLQVSTNGQEVIVGWVHERDDGGRSFATTLGHFYRNFQIDAFRRMIVNGILWTAHRDVPESGAPIELTPEALALPEE